MASRAATVSAQKLRKGAGMNNDDLARSGGGSGGLASSGGSRDGGASSGGSHAERASSGGSRAVRASSVEHSARKARSVGLNAGMARIGGTNGFVSPGQVSRVNFVSIDEYNILRKENESLKSTISKMEKNVASTGKKGRSSRDKKDWTPMMYSNDDRIRRYIRDTVWPHYNRLSSGWDKYSTNPKSLCARIMEIVVIERGETEKGTWHGKCAPSLNNVFIDLMSKDTAGCKRQFKGECDDYVC